MSANYQEDNIKTLVFPENIRTRPGMYIGKLGDGSSPDDGIYILMKEVLDNSIDEYMMGNGKQIELTIEDNRIAIRDYGRGIPLGSVLDVASKLHTGAKFDTVAFKKSVGLNGIGIKAVNALSAEFTVRSFRDGRTKAVSFKQGYLAEDAPETNTNLPNGTLITFVPDDALFVNYRIVPEYIEKLLKNYIFLNSGLAILFNGTPYVSQNGLLDLLNDNMSEAGLYPPIHLKGNDIEIAVCHGMQYGEEYYSFANGQYTPQGGTHQQAFREAYVKAIREFYRKEYDASDVRASIIAAVSIKLEEPMFESQTKTKLGSKEMAPGSDLTVAKFIGDFVKRELDNYLHRHPDVANAILQKITESEKERKALSEIRKVAKERARKASLHNKNLRDCTVHYTDKHAKAAESTIFITEGRSASGTITKVRQPDTQAVFSLRGKPLNSFKEPLKMLKNEEFNLLQAALNIEEDLDNLRYNNIVIASDADPDGMHIRILLITFFLKFYPELVRKGHLHILQTPLFRVRNKKETIYCYSDNEKEKALKKLGNTAEITRFKGLGEMQDEDFAELIGNNIRLDTVLLSKTDLIQELLTFYVGDNTRERRYFIINNLRVEKDLTPEGTKAVA
ncbi:MAG: type IIA DNA topoisomerase subunit B [Bacteroidales bacterium]|jgi:topoisomerase-4 subunit B|nr:type IIA DNA topoisomerase subunit B [Bacteroidales bacterium]